MIKKIFKENILAVVFLLCLAFYGMQIENDGVIKISYQLSLTCLISSIAATGLFFMIPAKYASAAFMFMFMSVGVKFVLFSTFFGYGLYHTPSELVSTYVLAGLFALLLYKGSLFFFMHDEK